MPSEEQDLYNYEQRADFEFNHRENAALHELRVHQIELQVQNEELKETQHKLEKMRSMYSDLYNNAPVGYLTLNKLGLITRTNRTFLEMIRAEQKNLIGKPFKSLVYLDDQELWISRFKPFWNNPVSKKIEIRLVDDSEIPFYVRVLGRSVYLEDLSKSETTLMIAVIDINSEKIAEQNLNKAKKDAETANSAKSDFLAVMSHEIRTPLNAILGFTSLLIRETYDEQSLESLQIISSSGKLLLSVLNDILDISALESGKLKLVREVFSVRQLIESSGALAKGMLFSKNKNLDLTLNISPEISEYIVGDYNRILQILNNLISNAVKFTDEGQIDVQARLTSDGYIYFSIRDTGSGIPAARQKEVFEPFVQLKEQRKTSFAGTGLGLNIVKRLVELMGGKVFMTSTIGKLHGSTFTVELPYEPADPPAVKEADEKSLTNFTKCKILIAEDNPVNLNLVSKVLSKSGYETVTAINGIDAVSKFQTETDIGVILMDIQMPVMDGLSAAQEIRRIESENRTFSHTPIVALTATVSSDAQILCHNAGCDRYLTKPLNIDDLLSTIQELLAKN
ncbi:MAG TPA: ATP-binding protein [Leptospiraceae bacterium]|nr:ATP-binding protein [Leptospiraceae bacterium]HNF13133.1 ATP-binding protein [Leptospiraceae bacterium]HNH07904.1 ATP-binding protein [Leptospiraceae bacterium]HNI96431.1 ATP-binding protein [Leptospiraceae bacterium]HNM04216.1 ATP-binding protein [Leptospiraceae bacterium]